MPSLNASRAQTAANPNSVSNGGTPATVSPISPANLVQIPAAAPLDLPVAMPQRGVFPPNNVMVSDRSASTRVFRNQNMRSSVFQNVATPQATTVTAPVTASAIATALAILVNNQAAPDQDVLNFLSTTTIQAVVGANGQISFNSLVESQGDGLIHGDLIWDIDDAYSLWREDFRFLSSVAFNSTAVFTAQFPWFIAVPSGATCQSYNPGPPFIGALCQRTANAATNSCFVVPGNTVPNSTSASISDALFDHPSWKMVWNFGIMRPSISSTSVTTPFAFTKTSLYVGLANTPSSPQYSATTVPRPITFTGLRFDTDLGPALALTGATAGVGVTVYAGTITNGAGNAFVGSTFIVTGFSGADLANNGTFTCTASTATALTLNNAAGVTGSTGTSLTATGPQLNDTQFVFESVCNSIGISGNTRINIQGNTALTGITPTEGHFYRLEIECTSVGAVVMTLTDSVRTAGTGVVTAVAQFSAPLAVPKFSASNIAYQAGDGAAFIENAGTSATPFSGGSLITVAGTGATGIDGPQCVLSASQSGLTLNFYSAQTYSFTDASGATVTGYPAAYPYFVFGNDTNASPSAANSKGVALDFAAFVWNPGVGGNTSPASNPLLARYF